MMRARRGAAVDTRVARLPLVALRFHMDTRVTDLDETMGEVERRLIETTAQRANLVRHLRRNEEQRRGALQLMERQPLHAVRALHDGLAIIDDLGRTEARIVALKDQLELLALQRALAHSIAEGLRRLASDPAAFDERAGLLNQAARSMYQIVDEEHQALATRILDGPMQRLASASIEAELAGRLVDHDPVAAAEHAGRCRQEAVAAAQGLERVAARLQPISTERALSDALRDMISDGRGRIRLRVLGAPRRLGLLNEIALYRIVEEAVDNADTHGHSPNIEVTLAFHRDRVVLLVKDDGEGFDVVATEARLGRTRGLGLIKMQEQAALVGSRLEVRSLIGAGTEVRATVPQSD